jgi:hypothetical protein
VALDVNKVMAYATKHKAMSYGRMNETEKRLRDEVRELLNQAETADKEDDTRCGRDRRGNGLRRITTQNKSSYSPATISHLS